MATKDNVGRFVWYDCLAKDPQAAIAYYGEVVGWKSQRFGESHYTMFLGSQGPVGGVMELPAEAAKMGAPPHWMANVVVADVDAAVKQVEKLGGKVYKTPEEIPTVGRFAVVADREGASISLFTPAGDMPLHDTTKEGEFCWNELMTTDQASALSFYGEIFGWKKLDEMDMGPMGKYVLFGVGDKQLGGMMKKPTAEMPTAWGYYIAVADLAAATTRATKMGGKLLNGPMDVPGGRISQFVDPQGAFFSLHQGVAK
jgi:predicted enzyme related to lactoylglutathione lyase